mgnify:CR=1 FL=1
MLASWRESKDKNGEGIVHSRFGGQMDGTGNITVNGKPPQATRFVRLDGAGNLSVHEMTHYSEVEQAVVGAFIGSDMLAGHSLGANPTLGKELPAWLHEAVGPLSPDQAELRDGVLGAWAAIDGKEPNPSLSLEGAALCGTIVLALVPGWTCSADVEHLPRVVRPDIKIDGEEGDIVEVAESLTAGAQFKIGDVQYAIKSFHGFGTLYPNGEKGKQVFCIKY